MIVVFILPMVLWRMHKDKRAGVVADFGGLRGTNTELIDGYKRNAARWPAAGLKATVDSFAEEHAKQFSDALNTAGETVT